MRIREIIVLGPFAPITIFPTKFTDSLISNAKLAGFSLIVTVIISLVVMTALHVLLPGVQGTFLIPSVSFSTWTVPLREGSQNESRPNDYVA